MLTMYCYPRNSEVVLISSLVLLTGSPPVTLVDFKNAIKVDGTDEDVLIQTWLDSGVDLASKYTRRVLIVGDWLTYTDRFYYTLSLDVSPIDGSSVVVKYYDEDNDIQTLDADEYTVKNLGPDKYMQIVFDGTMPNIYDRYDAVQIEYEAGYATCPATIKTAIMQRAAAYYEIRQSEIVGASSTLIENGFYQTLFPYKML